MCVMLEGPRAPPLHPSTTHRARDDHHKRLAPVPGNVGGGIAEEGHELGCHLRGQAGRAHGGVSCGRGCPAAGATAAAGAAPVPLAAGEERAAAHAAPPPGDQGRPNLCPQQQHPPAQRCRERVVEPLNACGLLVLAFC